MDTALISFMIQTSSSIQSVHLIGSWDNFTKRYPMERDIRRARGQWRGCYAFEDIICDGDGRSSPKRTGGLKMGSTYYYYYELDDGTEHFDNSIPFTTSCPYLPGQPLNFLWVPIEIQPLRFRSASMSSMATQDLKTMNPADKFMAPRPPPPTPDMPRLNTSTSVLAKKRSARSLSPQSEKQQWSPRAFFGLRSPPSIPQDMDKRGRSSSTSKISQSANTSTSTLIGQDIRKTKSVPHTRDVSPQSQMRSHSRDPSPLRRQASNSTNSSTSNQSITTTHNNNIMGGLEIPDEIAEEGEDDDNFASQLERISMAIFTPLSPPPTSRPATHRTNSSIDKPLPQLPEKSALLPPALRLKTVQSIAELPRSHFSTSTICSDDSSPTQSHFSFDSTHSLSGLDGFEDGDEEGDTSADLSEEEPINSPIISYSHTRSFSGYSLPDAGDYGSGLTLRKKGSPLEERARFGTATTVAIGGVGGTGRGGDGGNLNALEQLLNEMGYLGDVIVGKEGGGLI